MYSIGQQVGIIKFDNMGGGGMEAKVCDICLEGKMPALTL